MRRLLTMFVAFVSLAGLAVGSGNAQAGKAVFDKSCKTCHGADGQGNPAGDRQDDEG